ncbi:MAG: cysteine desulfurase family protein [Faecalibacterium sp.]
MITNEPLHYLDNAATTMVAPAVATAVFDAMQAHWANPSSLYPIGARSEEALAAARASLARTLGCTPREFYFTSCGTESNNMAIGGFAKSKKFGKKIIVSGFEHPSVQRPIEQLAQEGYEVITIKPEADGHLDIDKMLNAVDKGTILVACMLINNETGVRNPVERLAAEVKKINNRTAVHVDAVQAWFKTPITLANIDSLSVSGHKIHAPKGIGGLYLAEKNWQTFAPPYLGGEQERQRRPGTENIPYAIGLATAAGLLSKTIKPRATAAAALNAQLRAGLAQFAEVSINSPADASPEILNLSEHCIKSQTMLSFLAQQQIYVSSGSACGRGAPSHTLAAMGKSPRAIDTALRVSLCAENTAADIDAFLNRLEDGLKTLQRF